GGGPRGRSRGRRRPPPPGPPLPARRAHAGRRAPPGDLPPPRAAALMAARAARVLAGTSGFSYPAWRGSFYPDELPAREMLRFYARALATVEINHTFHRLPTPELLTGWARQTPAGFRFALKAPQRITHVLRLRDAGE